MGVRTTAPLAGSNQPAPSEPGSVQSEASTDVAAQPGSTPVSPEPASAPNGDWFRQAANAMRFGTVPVEAQGNEAGRSEPEGPGKGQPDTTPESRPVEPSPSETGDRLTFTQEELDRKVQSEVDRRHAKLQREERIRRQQEEEIRLRDTDPWAWREAVKKREEAEAFEQKRIEESASLALANMHTYDKTVLDPLMLQIPVAERQKIVDAAGDLVGVAQRGAIHSAALKYLEKTQVERSRKTLMEDQTFVKEVLARYGGGSNEPDHTPAVGASAANPPNMNDVFRTMRRSSL